MAGAGGDDLESGGNRRAQLLNRSIGLDKGTLSQFAALDADLARRFDS